MVVEKLEERRVEKLEERRVEKPEERQAEKQEERRAEEQLEEQAEEQPAGTQAERLMPASCAARMHLLPAKVPAHGFAMPMAMERF
jgi:hypothetical protein